MRLLVVGGGGREHAIAWQCAQDPAVTEVLVAPGNAGTATEPRVRNVAVAADDVEGLISQARSNAVDLVIVGPEQPLVAGLVDACREAGIAAFGPTASAARLEGSKAFSKAFLQRHAIPTAAWARFDAFDAARAHLDSRPMPCVIKADGLAAGKGVVIAHDRDTAVAAARDMLIDARFGGAGNTVVIEDFLVGEEASLIAITDGRTILPLASSQDHKARDEGDQGPNTGGMGAYSPAPVLEGAAGERALRDVMQRTLDGLREDGIDYVGFLYAGLMVDADGQSSVLEYNCRLGDPETQPLLWRLQTPLHQLCKAALEQRLDAVTVQWHPDPAVGVVMAAQGYPGTVRTGDAIHGLEAAAGLPDVKVFHAGTAHAAGDIVTSGGRVLCATARAADVATAARRAYQAVDTITWDGAFCRRDIAYRAIRRLAHGHD